MKNLRQRIRPDKISCRPWSLWKQILPYLPVSGKTLFSNSGIPLDVLEMELRSEGYLREDELLEEVLKDPLGLKRVPGIIDSKEYEGDYGCFPNDWTEEDYKYHETATSGSPVARRVVHEREVRHERIRKNNRNVD